MPATEAPQTLDPSTVEPGRVGSIGRGLRLAASLAVVTGLLLGSFWGDDWSFPFGPLRMYSTSADPNGSISYDRIEALTADGAWHATNLTPKNIAMNRAEVEGRTRAIVADPSLLRLIAQAHGRLHPQMPWTGVRLFKVRVHLHHGVPQDSSDELLATWTAS